MKLNLSLLICVYSTVTNGALCSAIKSNHTMDAFIIGGLPTKISHSPHSVFLAVFYPDSSLCGSSVLNQEILLSAAHCVYFKGNFDITAYAGHEVLDQVKVTRKISKFVVHPRYNYDSDQNDLTILYVDAALPFGDNIKRVVVSPRFPDVEMASVAGWGRASQYSYTNSPVLKMTKQTLQEKYSCYQLSRGKDGVLCAGELRSNTNYPSQGDSGSALITDSYQQIGIVSYSLNVHPALVFYTNVSYYYSWIKSISQTYICYK